MCRQRLHRPRVHRDLHLVPIRRRHHEHAHDREGVHEGRVAEAPQPEHAECHADLVQAERQVRRLAVDRGVDLDVAMEVDAEDATLVETVDVTSEGRVVLLGLVAESECWGCPTDVARRVVDWAVGLGTVVKPHTSC